MNKYIDILDEKLKRFWILNVIEDKTTVKKTNVFFLLSALFIYLFIGMNTMIKLFSTSFLIWKSYVVLYSIDKIEHKKCVIDWIIYGIFIMIELFADNISFVIPFYHTVKMLVLAWLFSGWSNGSDKIYKGYVEPYFKKYDITMMSISDILKKIDFKDMYKDNENVDFEKLRTFIRSNLSEHLNNIDVTSLELSMDRIAELYEKFIKIHKVTEEFKEKHMSESKTEEIQDDPQSSVVTENVDIKSNEELKLS